MDNPDWYYSPTATWVRILRFLNMMEDDRPVLSVTKLGVWATTIQTICMAIFATNPVTVGVSAANSLGWIAAHRVAQGQKYRRDNGNGT